MRSGAYNTKIQRLPQTLIHERADRDGDGLARVIGLLIRDQSGNTDMLPLSSERKQIVIDVDCIQDVLLAGVAVAVLTGERNRVLWMNSSDQIESCRLSRGRHRITLDLRGGVSPPPGDYYLNVALMGSEGMLDYIADAHKFTITDGDFFGSGRFPDTAPAVFVEHDWKIELI